MGQRTLLQTRSNRDRADNTASLHVKQEWDKEYCSTPGQTETDGRKYCFTLSYTNQNERVWDTTSLQVNRDRVREYYFTPGHTEERAGNTILLLIILTETRAGNTTSLT